MNKLVLGTTAAMLAAALASAPGHATGKMTCDAGPQSGWKSQADLAKSLTSQGWQVRKTKIDGGCYEVYGTMPNGDRVEAYYHPVTFKQLLVSRRGQVVYRADGK